MNSAAIERPVRKQSIARPIIDCAAQRDLKIAQTDRSRAALVLR